jgi:hypothetical protein
MRCVELGNATHPALGKLTQRLVEAQYRLDQLDSGRF